jgi:hypothetical protein
MSLDTPAKHIEHQLKERGFCVVFEDELAHWWPSENIQPAEREGQIKDFAESRGWTASILESDSGYTRAIFEYW